MVLRLFRHKGLQRLFETGDASAIGKPFAKRALMILDHLDAIVVLEDCVGVRDFHG